VATLATPEWKAERFHVSPGLDVSSGPFWRTNCGLEPGEHLQKRLMRNSPIHRLGSNMAKRLMKYGRNTVWRVGGKVDRLG
jgi:hypothetical protein